MTTRKTKSTAKGTKKTSKSGARSKPASQNEGRLRVRMYRVGFGDFFLVIVPTSAGDQHILIDCGVFKGTSGTGDIGSIVEAVEDMYQTTNGHLALVIMTHRHADHIAGFSKAERFKDFTASLVWMPYWEQFNDDKEKGSAHNLQLDINQLAANLAMQFRGRADDDAKEALAQLGNATGIEDFNAAATTKRKGGNAGALDLLKNHLGANGKNVRYYAAGDKPELPDELDGLKATILGPPPEKAKAFLALMDLKKGVGQYLDSMTDGDEGPSAIQPFPKEWTGDSKKHYPKQDVRGFAINYEQSIKDVNNAQPDMLVAAAGKIENFLNNQSLVVLFEFDGKKLLFAGDAQGGNWEYWLFKTEGPQKDPTKAGDIIEASKELLQTIDFYKVGHHGSTNATPIQAIEAAIARPKTSKGFVSMCSTEDGVYGNPTKETEVPRIRLMDVLEKGSCLLRSDAIEISVTDAETNKKKTIAARKGATLPQPKVGKLSQAALYLEYAL